MMGNINLTDCRDIKISMKYTFLNYIQCVTHFNVIYTIPHIIFYSFIPKATNTMGIIGTFGCC